MRMHLPRTRYWLLPLSLAGLLIGCEQDALLKIKVMTQVDTVAYQIFDDPECNGEPYTEGNPLIDAVFDGQEETGGPFRANTEFGQRVGSKYHGKTVRLEMYMTYEGNDMYGCICPQMPKKALDVVELPVTPIRGGIPRECDEVSIDDLKALVDNTVGCETDFQCRSGHCECANSDCTKKVCAAEFCPCQTVTDDGSSCESGLEPGTRDDDGCVGECGPDGECFPKRVGDICDCEDGEFTDSECRTSPCECFEDNCTERICAEDPCDTCQHVVRAADGAMHCEDSDLGSPGKNCVADGYACDGNGHCLKDIGTECDLDSECLSDNCECQDATCTVTICAENDCDCQYSETGYGYCSGILDEGTKDNDECVSTFCRGGQCARALGEPCTNNDGCVSEHCACTDDACTARICHQTGCPTCYHAASSTGCTFSEPNTQGPGCFDLGKACDGNGNCRAAVGYACAIDTDCASAQCECADAACSVMRCHETGCGQCEWISTGIDACTSTPAGYHGSGCRADHYACDDNQNCDWDIGEPCSRDEECAEGHCECTDSTCGRTDPSDPPSGTICAHRDCDCGFISSTSLDICNPAQIDDGFQDNGMCLGAGRACDGLGSCEAALGAQCLNDSECAQGTCECTDELCGDIDPTDAIHAIRYCAPDDCALCQWLRLEPLGCQPTTAGRKGQDCFGPADACDGTANPDRCKLDNLEPCNDDSECGSGVCECADATCTTRRCRQTHCQTCRYVDIDGSCVATPQGNRGALCDNAGDACNASLQCRAAPGIECEDDSDCAHGHCDCANADCTLTECHEDGCAPCQYDLDGRGSCYYTPAGNAGQGCSETGQACAADHSCQLANGELCTGFPDGSTCGSGNCECADATCSTRRCHHESCATCEYVNGATGECDTTPKGNDGENCVAPETACDGNSPGACKDAPGQTCAADSECAHAHCVCADGNCGSKKCHDDNPGCTVCQYSDVDPLVPCLNTPTGNDGQGCEGATTACDGNGTAESCKAAPGQDCTSEGDDHCAHGHCVCADNNCGSKVCHDTDPGCDQCEFDTDGTGNCSPTPRGNRGQDCTDPYRCNDNGNCELLVNGEDCTSTPTLCVSGNCVCSNIDCSTRVCHDAAQSECDFFNGTGWSPLAVGYSDHDTCTAADETCDGSGNCKIALGYECPTGSDAACAYGHCVCGDGDCTTYICHETGNGCDECTYAENAYDNCVLTDPGYHGQNCVSDPTRICDGAGQCLKTGGETCDLSSECASGICNRPMSSALKYCFAAGGPYVAHIAAGGTHTAAALHSDKNGLARTWGSNDSGQLGNEDLDNTTCGVECSTTPIVVCPSTGCDPGPPVAQLSDIIAVTAGHDHVCATRDATTRELWCWGKGQYGRLGNGSTTDQPLPVKIDSFVPHQSPVALSAGSAHTCAIKDDATLWCWGFNEFGRLGDGFTANRTTPFPVCDDSVCSGQFGNTLQVSAGRYHTCAVTTGFGLYCWGGNDVGQLGNGASGAGTDEYAPVHILSGIGMVAAGYQHTCALVNSDGGVLCWGSNLYGQLGNGSTMGAGQLSATPVSVCGTAGCADLTEPQLTGVVALAAGGYHTCAIVGSETRELVCWGRDSDGQIGNGLPKGAAYSETIPVTVLPDAVLAVTAGEYNTCALLTDGSMRCWGDNDLGQVGDGDPLSDKASPTAVTSWPPAD